MRPGLLLLLAYYDLMEILDSLDDDFDDESEVNDDER